MVASYFYCSHGAEFSHILPGVNIMYVLFQHRSCGKNSYYIKDSNLHQELFMQHFSLAMVPSATSDPALLREHAFYETGNLKHVLPFIKFLNYELPQGPSNPLSSTSTMILSVVGLVALYCLFKFVTKTKEIKQGVVNLVQIEREENLVSTTNNTTVFEFDNNASGS